MRKLLLVILFTVLITSAQNPDGDNLSIHFFPYFTDGKYEVEEISGKAVGDFGFDFKMKIPIASSFTIIPYISSDYYSFNLENKVNNKTTIQKTSMRFTKYGIGFSIYF